RAPSPRRGGGEGRGARSSRRWGRCVPSVSRRLTDEELMRACGGRTAHKGARHGMTMSAKLARLEEQERAFLATYRHKESSPPAERREKRKKKKRKRSGDGADPEVPQGREPSGEGEVVGEQGKVVKRKKKQQQQEEEDDEEEPAEKEEKRKKEEQEEEEEEKVEPAETEEEEKRKKKKKKKKKEE
ncbi:GPTC4 protein, partial [Lophotis ruficrista]|nr:GPTC4 protein [Lophotis ruficrista]